MAGIPVSEQVIFANVAAEVLMFENSLDDMRKGIFSASAQTQLSMYVSNLKSELEIIEIWTILRGNIIPP